MKQSVQREIGGGIPRENGGCTLGQLLKQAAAVSVHRVDYQPIIRAFMQRLGLVELIDQMTASNMEVSRGLVVAGMIQDTFSGRSPLYRLEESLASEDMELAIGQEVAEGTFADHHVGRVLDLLYEVGPSRIFSEIGRRACELFGIERKEGHWDSTSVTVFGDYDVYDKDVDGENGRLHITFGYSKDKRPDLKQFLVSMLCVEHNIPIIGGCHDGNRSDKSLNNTLLSRLSQILAAHEIGEGAFTYAADSAVVTEENLKYFGRQENGTIVYFVTRLPFSDAEADRVVTAAVRADRWEELGVLGKTRATAKRPHAVYRACESEVTLYGQRYRAIVIHSSAHDKRRLKKLERELSTARQALEKERWRARRREYACQADAEAELHRLQEVDHDYYRITGRVEKVVRYGRGRPSKEGERRIGKGSYRLQADIQKKEEVIRKKQEEAGCFVLLSNRPVEGGEGQRAGELLRSYKGQDGIEHNFSFLKDPMMINSIFLKKPERIEALGLILLTCLLIWNLMQRQMRQYLEREELSLQGWDGKPTTRPTAFMMTTKFCGILILKSGDHRVLAKPLTAVQRSYLKALGLNTSIFTDPRAPP